MCSVRQTWNSYPVELMLNFQLNLRSPPNRLQFGQNCGKWASFLGCSTCVYNMIYNNDVVYTLYFMRSLCYVIDMDLKIADNPLCRAHIERHNSFRESYKNWRPRPKRLEKLFGFRTSLRHFFFFFNVNLFFSFYHVN